MTSFTDLGLAEPLLKALAAEGYENPTPIQAQAIPPAMEGRDLLGIAQTGTGKTAAFALPILHRLAANRQQPPRRGCRVLVLSPTRELASQIADSFRVYGRHLGVTVTVIFGGVGHAPQTRAMARGVDVLVATPGRLLDHVNTRTVDLRGTEILVLDEADQMLDLGFVVPIRRIVQQLSARRQNLFFSATMPKEIGKLASELLVEPVQVSVAPVATTVERVTQEVILVETDRKRDLLAELLSNPAFERTLVFCRTKHRADRVTRHLEEAGISAAAIHGDKSQGQRERALLSFRKGQTRVLVATDIAARGIDVDGVTHVVNFELPNVPESYVHRIGRTARAGNAGIAISLCDQEERGFLRDIERLTRLTLPVTDRRISRGGPARPQQPQGQRPPQGQRQPQPHRPHQGEARHGEGRNGGGRHVEARHGEGRNADSRGQHDDTLSNVAFLSRPDAAGRGNQPARPHQGAAKPGAGNHAPVRGGDRSRAEDRPRRRSHAG